MLKYNIGIIIFVPFAAALPKNLISQISSTINREYRNNNPRFLQRSQYSVDEWLKPLVRIYWDLFMLFQFRQYIVGAKWMTLCETNWSLDSPAFRAPDCWAVFDLLNTGLLEPFLFIRVSRAVEHQLSDISESWVYGSHTFNWETAFSTDREQANPRPQTLRVSRSFKAVGASWTCPKRRAVPMWSWCFSVSPVLSFNCGR